MHLEQYKLVHARRLQQDNMVWQTPTLAAAVTAFLLSISFNPQIDRAAAMAVGVFSAFVALAAIQLMAKHRQLEIEDAHRMHAYEKANEGFEELHHKTARVDTKPRHWFVDAPSSWIWIAILVGLAMISLYSAWEAYVRTAPAPPLACISVKDVCHKK